MRLSIVVPVYREGEAARATLETLGIPRKTFYDKLARHGIDRAAYAMAE